MKTVTIVQEYIPTYRVAFFEELRRQAIQSEIRVVHGGANRDQAMRGDADEVVWATKIKQREWRPFGKRIVFRRMPRWVWQSDLVVLEQARRNVDAYRLLLPCVRKNLALWGHGVDFVKRPTDFERSLQQKLTSRAKHVFVYTAGGASRLVSLGIGEADITVVQNSTDTAGFSDALNSVTRNDEISWRNQLRLPRGFTALYVGAIDPSKNIDFLLGAAAHAYELDSRFRLLVVGDGPLRAEVTRAAENNPYLRYLGPLNGFEKALCFKSARILAIPGRVGLIAVDSVVSGLPIVTIQGVDHAPEYEYLTENQAVTVTADSQVGYGAEMIDLMSNAARLGELRIRLHEMSARFSVEEMSARFIEGLEVALSK